MSDSGLDNLVLNLLGQVRGDVRELKTDIIEVKERTGFLEGGMASVFRQLDRLAGDVDESKGRLELSAAPHG